MHQRPLISLQFPILTRKTYRLFCLAVLLTKDNIFLSQFSGFSSEKDSELQDECNVNVKDIIDLFMETIIKKMGRIQDKDLWILSKKSGKVT